MKRKLSLFIALSAVATFATAFGTGCNIPNDKDDTPETPAHNYGEWVIDREPTCTAVGQKYHVCQDEGCNELQWEAIPMTDHNYKVDSITATEHNLKCEVCNINSTAEHTFNLSGFCSVCGYERNTTIGFSFMLNEDRSSYSIIGHGTILENNKPASGYGYHISIPSVHLGLPVTKIERLMDDNFYIIITELKIPQSVISVGNSLDQLASLKNIIVDEANPALKSVDGNLYSKDGKSLIRYAGAKPERQFNIPATVTAILPYAFYYSKLESILIPENTTLINKYAFWQSTNLNSVIFENKSHWNLENQDIPVAGDSAVELKEEELNDPANAAKLLTVDHYSDTWHRKTNN